MNLIKSGVPPVLVFGQKAEYKAMDKIEREAWLIVLGQMDGHKFDFSAWRWVER